MITERDLVPALPTIIISVVTVSIAAWLWYALTRPQKNVRIAVILNGLAVISFLIGESISVGPNPKHDYGGFKNVRTINSGPAWGVSSA